MLPDLKYYNNSQKISAKIIIYKKYTTSFKVYEDKIFQTFNFCRFFGFSQFFNNFRLR